MTVLTALTSDHPGRYFSRFRRLVWAFAWVVSAVPALALDPEAEPDEPYQAPVHHLCVLRALYEEAEHCVVISR